MPSLVFKNTLLKALDEDVIGRLRLTRVKLELEHEIEFPGQTLDNLFFVEEGMASMTVTFRDGSQVEVGMFGYESVIGISALMGATTSLNRVYTQIAGYGYCCSRELAKTEFSRCGRFQNLALRYVEAQLVQAMQSAACNAKHPVEQRLARWLLLCSGRANSRSYRISHQFLAEMLGCSRPALSTTALRLKNEGLVDYSRGTLRILNHHGLELRACECYGVIKSYLESYAQFDSGIVA